MGSDPDSCVIADSIGDPENSGSSSTDMQQRCSVTWFDESGRMRPMRCSARYSESPSSPLYFRPPSTRCQAVALRDRNQAHRTHRRSEARRVRAIGRLLSEQMPPEDESEDLTPWGDKAHSAARTFMTRTTVLCGSTEPAPGSGDRGAELSRCCVRLGRVAGGDECCQPGLVLGQSSRAGFGRPCVLRF